MQDIHFIPAGAPLVYPPDLFRMPTRLILDIGEAIKAFQKDIQEAEEYEHCIDEIVAEILMYIGNIHNVPLALMALDNDLRRCYEEDGPLLAPAAVKLGKALVSQFELFGMYTSDGLLHYRMGDWFDGHTPTLIRANLKQERKDRKSAKAALHALRVIYPDGRIEDGTATPEELQARVKNFALNPAGTLFVDNLCVCHASAPVTARFPMHV